MLPLPRKKRSIEKDVGATVKRNGVVQVVGRKRNQQQHISSAHDCRLGALLWHQMVDRRSTWGKSDSFCQPADLGWQTISPLRMTTI